MSISVFQCDTCARSINIDETSQIVSSRCVITKYCKGTLRKQFNKSYKHNNNLTVVDGIDNYEKTSRLYKHTQKLPSSTWNIQHNLNSISNVIIYVNAIVNEKQTLKQIDSDSYVILKNEPNLIIVQFENPILGQAHVITSNNTTYTSTKETVTTLSQLTANGFLTLAVPVSEIDAEKAIFELNFIAPSSNKVTSADITFNAHKYQSSVSLFNTPWKNAQLIVWNDTLYRVHSIRTQNIFNQLYIEDQSNFFFTDPKGSLILTSNNPYEVFADTSQKIIKCELLTSRNDITFCSSGDWMVDDKLKIVYPPEIQIIKTIFD